MGRKKKVTPEEVVGVPVNDYCVVTLGEYLGRVEGSGPIRIKRALDLLAEENDIVCSVNRSDDTYFIVK